MTRILETERLCLDRLTLEDDAFILEHLNDPSFQEHIGDKGVRTLADARDYLRDGPLKSYDRYGFGLFRVSLRDGTPIGTCGLLKRDCLPEVDVGYALLPAYWGQGYAYEAAAAVLDWGRKTHGLERVIAIVAPGNASSIRLLEKLGLRFETSIRLPGESEKVALYAPR